MGLRLEIVIIIAIVAILSGTLMVKFVHKSSDGKTFTKELEFTSTTLTEVDIVTMQGRVFSTYGMRDAGVLTLHNIAYYTNHIESLYAKKATYKGDNIYLDGNISVNQKEGFNYRAEHAVYNQKTQILDITSAFTGIMNRNIIHGDTLRYDTQKKEAYGKRIDAVIYTTEK